MSGPLQTISVGSKVLHGLSGGGGPDPAVAPLSRRVPGHPQLHGSILGCGPGRADVARQGHKGENDSVASLA